MEHPRSSCARRKTALVAGLVASALGLGVTVASAATSIPAPGFQPSGLAADGASLYAVEVSGFRQIFRLDPATGAVLGSMLAPSPNGLDGRGSPSDIVADGEGRLFVSDVGAFGAGIVYEIDPADPAILGSFTLPFRGGAIAFDGSRLYIGDFDSGQILVTDRSGQPIRTIQTSLRPAGFVFDDGADRLWVIDTIDRTISQIDTNGAVVRTCEGPRSPGVQGLGGVTRLGPVLYISEVTDPDPFAPPEVPGTIFVVEPRELRCVPSLAIPVTIDVGPGNGENPINPRLQGVVHVAILTDTAFDAAGLDHGSIRFGTTGIEAAPTHFDERDVDGDGDVDLVLRFSMPATGIACGTTTASLTAATLDGEAVSGSAALRTVGCR